MVDLSTSSTPIVNIGMPVEELVAPSIDHQVSHIIVVNCNRFVTHFGLIAVKQCITAGISNLDNHTSGVFDT